jgi:hypothetical protein
MPDNDAEVSVVKNGTLMRWTGSDAERIALFLSRCGFRDPDLPVRMGDLDIGPPTTTRPLRRVTEIRGSYSSLNNEIIEDDVRALFAVTLRDLMPSNCTSRRARIRITVEAEEEKDR